MGSLAQDGVTLCNTALITREGRGGGGGGGCKGVKRKEKENTLSILSVKTLSFLWLLIRRTEQDRLLIDYL